MIITPRQAQEVGLSQSGLYRAVRAGRYERIARGVYLPRPSGEPGDAIVEGAADWDWLEAAARRPGAIVCLTSALARHDLTDAIPDALDVALPRGSRPPTTRSAIRWHLFDRATFSLGRVDMAIPGSQLTIGIYSPERCIVDAFRLRGEVGYELGRDALKEWLRRGGKPADLMSLAAQVPRAKKPLLDALQVLT